MTTIYTIGHSTRPIDDLARMLTDQHINVLVDVRTYPTSRRCPQYCQDSMAHYLHTRGVEYVHLPDLGGRRPRQHGVDPHVNAAWTNTSFKNYADYTLTGGYERGLARLLDLAAGARVCYMCSEAVPWRCHRLLISNTLASRGHHVVHIMDAGHTQEHRLGLWGARAVAEGGVVYYPAVTPVQMQLAI